MTASNPDFDDVLVLLPARIRDASAKARASLTAELVAMIDAAPTGSGLPPWPGGDDPATFKVWVSAVIASLPTHPEGGNPHGNR
jgi:hypothetical protein